MNFEEQLEEADALEFAAHCLRTQALGEKLRIDLERFEAVYTEARVAASAIAGCDIEGWGPDTVQRYLALYLRKERIPHDSRCTEETWGDPRWYYGSPTVRRKLHNRRIRK